VKMVSSKTSTNNRLFSGHNFQVSNFKTRTLTITNTFQNEDWNICL
jgi:hypothetical protein